MYTQVSIMSPLGVRYAPGSFLFGPQTFPTPPSAVLTTSLFWSITGCVIIGLSHILKINMIKICAFCLLSFATNVFLIEKVLIEKMLINISGHRLPNHISSYVMTSLLTCCRHHGYDLAHFMKQVWHAWFIWQSYSPDTKTVEVHMYFYTDTSFHSDEGSA